MSIRTIDAPTLKSWMDSREAFVLDVREPAEYASEHIAGAELMPLGTLQKTNLPKLAGQKLVIHCRKGGRGQSACEKLRELMPETDIYNLAGGLESWIAAGFPVQKSGRTMLPLDRQVQLTVGLCVLIGTLLGAYHNPVFLIIPAFFGAGLAFAGLSGFCGLARLLALMPWNR